jgi:hypothetical protein
MVSLLRVFSLVLMTMTMTILCRWLLLPLVRLSLLPPVLLAYLLHLWPLAYLLHLWPLLRLVLRLSCLLRP